MSLDKNVIKIKHLFMFTDIKDLNITYSIVYGVQLIYCLILISLLKNLK